MLLVPKRLEKRLKKVHKALYLSKVGLVLKKQTSMRQSKITTYFSAVSKRSSSKKEKTMSAAGGGNGEQQQQQQQQQPQQDHVGPNGASQGYDASTGTPATTLDLFQEAMSRGEIPSVGKVFGAIRDKSLSHDEGKALLELINLANGGGGGETPAASEKEKSICSNPVERELPEDFCLLESPMLTNDWLTQQQDTHYADQVQTNYLAEFIKQNEKLLERMDSKGAKLFKRFRQIQFAQGLQASKDVRRMRGGGDLPTDTKIKVENTLRLKNATPEFVTHLGHTMALCYAGTGDAFKLRKFYYKSKGEFQKNPRCEEFTQSYPIKMIPALVLGLSKMYAFAMEKLEKEGKDQCLATQTPALKVPVAEEYLTEKSVTPPDLKLEHQRFKQLAQEQNEMLAGYPAYGGAYATQLAHRQSQHFMRYKNPYHAGSAPPPPQPQDDMYMDMY